MDDSNTPIFLHTVNGTKQTRTGICFAFIFRALCIWLLLRESEAVIAETMTTETTGVQAGSAGSLLRSGSSSIFPLSSS